jgi:hypothetical protein
MFKYIDAPGYPEIKLTWPFRLGRKILDSKADHIHIATEGPLGFFARCWLDRKGWKYIYINWISTMGVNWNWCAILAR